MGIFGWSYPPGAANDPYAPYNQHAEPCEVCGQGELACMCDECPVCGEAGNINCYVEHGMSRTTAQINGIVDLAVSDEQRREACEAEARYWMKQRELDIDKES